MASRKGKRNAKGNRHNVRRGTRQKAASLAQLEKFQPVIVSWELLKDLTQRNCEKQQEEADASSNSIPQPGGPAAAVFRPLG